MDVERTEAIRHEGNLQNITKRYRIFLDTKVDNADAIYRYISEVLIKEYEEDYSKIIEYIRLKLDWPFVYKRKLLQCISKCQSNTEDRFNNLAKFVFNPTSKIKQKTSFRKFNLQTASIERQYGSAVSSILQLQYGFFLFNLLTLIVWIALIILPHQFLSSSSFSSKSFSISSLFTTKDFLAESIFFQGSYSNEILKNSYNLPLIYFLTTYFYFFLWFIYLTVRFASTYKQKVLNSILNSKLGIGFMCTFGRLNFTIRSDSEKSKYTKVFQRQFLDLIGNDERFKQNQSFQFKTWSYKLKIIITHLFYVILAIILGGINWLVLNHYSETPFVDRYGSIIFVALINRLMPYGIVILTQIESYKYLSYRLDAVGFRCILVNICTVLSFTIFFFINSPSCYETVYGQLIYVLLLADLFASLIFPIVFGLLFDLFLAKKNRDFDGINIHVQITPSVLLYSQFLIWLAIYFTPLLSVMILINLLFSYVSHRLYLFIRSRNFDSYKRVLIWNAHRLKFLNYLFGYLLLIISVTSFVVFTTQLQPSVDCGPFRQLNVSYEIVTKFVDNYQTSVLAISVINFVSSPGFSYFLFITFSIVVYKLRHEGLAEKQLVFIRENNLESKKRLRENVVRKLHRQTRTRINQNEQPIVKQKF